MLGNVFEIVFLVGFVVGSVVRKVYTGGRREKPRTRRMTVADTVVVSVAGVALVVLPMVYVFSPWLDFADYHLPAWTGWAGAAVFAAAIWLLWRSHADLGRNWSPVVQVLKEHTLVTDGVYRHIRHPMYSAHFLWGIAQALLLQNWIAGPALLVVFVPFCLVRVPHEERLMLETFGDEYRVYMSRTGRIFPRRRNAGGGR